MSQEETQGQEHVSAHQPAADAGANEVRTPAPRLNEAKLESAHAELPPLSVIGASSEPAAKPGTITAPKQFGRRGTPRGAAPSAANGQAARPAIGVVEDPSQLTENLSGDRTQSAAPAREDRPRREPPPKVNVAPAANPASPASLVRKVSPKKAANPASRRVTALVANPAPKVNVAPAANPANRAPKAIVVLAPKATALVAKIVLVAKTVRASRSSPSSSRSRPPSASGLR